MVETPEQFLEQLERMEYFSKEFDTAMRFEHFNTIHVVDKAHGEARKKLIAMYQKLYDQLNKEG